jgi:hypothetical protein
LSVSREKNTKIKMEEVGFSLPGIAWNGRSSFLPDWNSYSWQTSVFTQKKLCRPWSKKSKFGQARLFSKREREERKKEKENEGFPRPGGNFGVFAFGRQQSCLTKA